VLVVGAIDHASDDIVGGTSRKSAIAGPRSNRFAPARVWPSAPSAKNVARGLTVRSDWWPQYIADALRERAGVARHHAQHSFVRERQCNGIIERFIRTLKEESLWLHRFDSLEEARGIIGAFVERCICHWLIERLDHRSAAVARRELLAAA
jgi:putative transposase